ncbi:MAG: aspartate aminotransferase family protein, partial [Mycobacterium sp.]
MSSFTDVARLPNGQVLDAAIAEGKRAYELDRAHVFHSWSAQGQITPMTIVAAEGSYVWDGEGNKL